MFSKLMGLLKRKGRAESHAVAPVQGLDRPEDQKEEVKAVRPVVIRMRRKVPRRALGEKRRKRARRKNARRMRRVKGCRPTY